MFKPPKGPPWNWTPAGLSPEIARLVARPILVVPFGGFGNAPLEHAKKQSAIVNGTVASVKTPYGPGVSFIQTTIVSPTDFLSFRGTYPSTNATAVPHSIAVLYSPRVSGLHVPFSLGTSASNRSVGIVCDFGGNNFQVVHYGIIGFSAIGATPVAGRYYLQLYSYDQVTMNHLVVDLNTGAVASQSVAETRAIVNASPGPIIGLTGSNEALRGSVVGFAWVRGAWTIKEMEILARNPTGLWTPSPAARRRISYAAPAGGGGTIASGAGQSTSGSTALGAGVSITLASGGAVSHSTAAGVGVAITAVAGVATAPSLAAGSGAARADGAGQSTSASLANGSNNNIAQAAGTSSASSVAVGAAAPIASGDGQSRSPSSARTPSSALAAGAGVSAVVSIGRAIAEAIASAIGWSSSSSRAVGDVSPPFNPSTLVRAPHYMEFAELATAIDFDELATFLDFDDHATRLVFLTPQGAEIMGELRLVEGEVRDVEYVVKGAGGVPLDLTNSTSRKLTVRVPGAVPRVDQVDVTVVGAATDGRLKYAANAALAGVAGRYKALTVITYPGGVIVKSPGEVLVDSAIV